MPRGVRTIKTADERKSELRSGLEQLQERIKKDTEKMEEIKKQIKEIEQTELVSKLLQVADKEGKSVEELLKPIIGN